MIGILAGMGPKSTGPFITQVVTAFQSITGAKNDIDFPPMMIYSLPTPFYLDRPIDHKLMEKTICEGLKKLQECGVSFIAMPCNTAHLYFEALQKSIHVPLLNIVEATLRAMPFSAKKVAILGTRPTIDSQIFQKGLQNAGFESIMHPCRQEKIDAMIAAVKAEECIEGSLCLWEDLSKSLFQEGVDTVLLGCTDLHVIFERITTPFQIIDSSSCLAKAVACQWLECMNL